MEKKLFNIKTVACRNEHCTKHTQHHILLKAEEDCVHQHRTAQSLEVTTRHRAGVGLTTPPSSLSLSYFLSHDRHSLISPFLLPPAPPSLPPSPPPSLSLPKLHCTAVRRYSIRKAVEYKLESLMVQHTHTHTHTLTHRSPGKRVKGRCRLISHTSKCKGMRRL